MVAIKNILFAAAALAASVNAVPLEQRDSNAGPIVSLIGSVVQGFAGQVTNITEDLVNQGDSTDAGRMYVALDSLDHVVDSTAGFLGKFLSPVTGGLSEDIVDFAAGPIVQGINHGLFSLVSLVGGGALDALTGNSNALGALQGIVSGSNNIADTISKAGGNSTAISEGTSSLQTAIDGLKANWEKQNAATTSA